MAASKPPQQLNSALLFIKPHAVTKEAQSMVEEVLASRGVRIVRELRIEGSVIDRDKLIDKHYYTIASKATLTSAPRLCVPQDHFKRHCGLEWDEAVKANRVANALEACERLGVDGATLGELWTEARRLGHVAKFGGGFYCGKIAVEGKEPLFVFNGFFLELRERYVVPGAAIHCYVVEWDPLLLPWADFRHAVLGATDPAQAPPDSLRGRFTAQWKELGLPSPPTVADNGVHASASSLEAVCERVNWLGTSLESDPFGQLLLSAGISAKQFEEWSKDPQVRYGPEGATSSIFDLLEDTDADRCISMCQALAGVSGSAQATVAATDQFADPKLQPLAYLGPSQSRIRQLRAREILDARGEPTLEVDLITDDGLFRGTVPNGSAGSCEVIGLCEPGRLMGRAATQAVANVASVIAPRLLGMDVTQQQAIDKILVRELDGRRDEWDASKSRLGVSAILAVSIAVCRAGAQACGLMLCEYLAKLAGKATDRFVLPVPAFNVITGTREADNGPVACLEFMVLPMGARTFREAMTIGAEVYHKLRGIVKAKHGQDRCNVGDEGSLAFRAQDCPEALDAVMSALTESGHSSKAKIAIDMAASAACDRSTGLYELGSSSTSTRGKTAAQLTELYQEWMLKYPLVSIEDPFDKEDFDAHGKLMEACGERQQVVGDELLTSDPARIQKAASAGACSAVLLRLTQVGTVTAAIQVAMMADSLGLAVVVSHSAGDTEDAFIAELAVGLSAGQIKAGAPCRSERVAKYNELLRMEEELGDCSTYAGERFRLLRGKL